MPRSSAHVMEDDSDIRRVNGWAKAAERYGVPTALISTLVGFGLWYAVAIYKPDHEQDRQDRKAQIESFAKVARAVEDQAKASESIVVGLEGLKDQTKETHTLQRETHNLMRDVRDELRKNFSHPIKVQPMGDVN